MVIITDERTAIVEINNHGDVDKRSGENKRRDAAIRREGEDA